MRKLTLSSTVKSSVLDVLVLVVKALGGRHYLDNLAACGTQVANRVRNSVYAYIHLIVNELASLANNRNSTADGIRKEDMILLYLQVRAQPWAGLTPDPQKGPRGYPGKYQNGCTPQEEGVLPSNDPRNNQHNPNTPTPGHRYRTNGTRRNQHGPSTSTTGLRERGNDTSGSTGRSGRQNAATRRNMRREERVTVQGPVKEQQPDGMSHPTPGPPPPRTKVTITGKILLDLFWQTNFWPPDPHRLLLSSDMSRGMPPVYPPPPVQPQGQAQGA